MAGSKRNNNGVPITEYEQRRNEKIEINNQKLDALGLPRMNSLEQHVQPSKRTKRTQQASDAATGHNLRTRSQRNRAENANEQIEDPDYQPPGDLLCDNEDLHNSPPKKRKGRSITRMESIFARTPSMPKIKIIVNELGQPVGPNYKQFTRAIGCLVRQTISVGCSDWRLVDIEKKNQVWKALKDIFDIDEAAKDWFLDNAATKWKEFKATLRAQFFDEKVTNEELQKKHGDRVKDTDWDFLIKHWSSPEFAARVEISKANRAKLAIHHTSGSKSFACSRHEMGVELGRLPRRDEVYIRTHTRKNGVPAQQAEPIINKLKSIVEAHPELMERSIQQGDIFAAACGEKEPRGRVRALGLGPTPQDVGTPGLKCYKSTRLQMEVLARKQAESDKASLEQQIQKLQEELQEARRVQERRNMEITSQNGSNSQNHVSPRSEGHVDEAYDDELYEDAIFADNNEHSDHYDEDEDDHLLDPRPPAAPSVQPTTSLFAQRAAVLSAQRAAALSASAQHAPTLCTQPATALSTQRAAALSQQRAAALTTPRAATLPAPCAAAPSVQRAPTGPSATAPSVQRAPTGPTAAALSVQRAPTGPSAAAPSVQRAPAPSVQRAPAPPVHRAPAPSVRSAVGGSTDHQDCSATSPMKSVVPTKKKNSPHVSPADLVGKEVILLAMLRKEAVAKGVVISTNPSNTLAGQPLGKLFCEVIVKNVLKRDTVLPRPYDDIQTLADAKSMPVQWPYNRLRPSKTQSSQSTAGSQEETPNSEFEENFPEDPQPEAPVGEDEEELPECPDHRASDFEKDGHTYHGYCETCLYPVD